MRPGAEAARDGPAAPLRGPEEDGRAAAVLDVAVALAAELHSSLPVDVGPDSRFDVDLGLDSLDMVELRSRLEEVFGVSLADRWLAVCLTAREWAEAIAGSSPPRDAPAPRAIPARPRAPADSKADSPSASRTIPDVLAWHVGAHPGRVHLRILQPGDDGLPPADVTYEELLRSSTAVGAGLQRLGLRTGQSVAIMLPTQRDYFDVFMGTLLAGGVPVPIYPPSRPAGLEDHLLRQAHILSSAHATVLVTDTVARPVARVLRSHVPSLRSVVTPGELAAPKPELLRPQLGSGSTALVQYTSGSTGHPKGVVLSHENILANLRALGVAAQVSPTDVFVSWLPLYHDMGLIGAWLGSLYFGLELVVMPPMAFLSRPRRWLQAISDYRGTITASPNFGYELCLRHVTDAELADLDLTSWRLALNGAEPVNAGTVTRFAERFGRSGFRPEVMTPVYGLAEAAVALTFPPLSRGPVLDAVDREQFSRNGRAEPAGPGDSAPTRFVSCGLPLPGYEVRVVDAAEHELPERDEGRIEFRGPSATSGYLGDAEATAAIRHGQWLDTGDLGYAADGELFVTGRAKDLIIRAGRNLHPEELEEALGALPGVRKGCVAVFATEDPSEGTERLVVLAETRLREPAALAQLQHRVRATSVELLGTPPDDVVLAPPGTVLKTSSGKIRRAASKQVYETGAVGGPTHGQYWQIARFAWRGARPQSRRTLQATTSLAYAAYAWAVIAVLGVPMWVAVMLLPTRRARWRLLRWAGNVLRRLLGLPYSASGGPPTTGPYVVVANHASFVDGLVLVLSLPEQVGFVAGGELATQRVAGPFLRRLGCEFTRPGDPAQTSHDVARLGDTLRGGGRLAFFPEGGVVRAPGLRPFHLGAFIAAARSGAPVVPVGIRGTRDVVRPGGRFPRRGAVEVHFGQPITSEGSEWADAVAVRDRARAAIAVLSGEHEVDRSSR